MIAAHRTSAPRCAKFLCCTHGAAHQRVLAFRPSVATLREIQTRLIGGGSLSVAPACPGPPRSCRRQRRCGGAPRSQAPHCPRAVANDNSQTSQRARVRCRARTRRRSRVGSRAGFVECADEPARGDRRDRRSVVRGPGSCRRPRPPDPVALQDLVRPAKNASTGSGRSPTSARSRSTRTAPRDSARCSGKDPLEIGRRAALIGQANSESQDAIDALNASVADLTAQRADLDRARKDLAETLRDLDTQSRTLDAQLAKLQLGSAKCR